MKKFFGSVAIMALASTFLWAGQAKADYADEAILNLSGEVEIVAEIGINEAAAQEIPGATVTKDDFDLTDAFTSATVAYVYEKCNDLEGYTITLTSANEGVLQGVTDDTFDHAYTMTYGGSAVTLSSGSAVVTNATAPSGDYPGWTENAVAVAFDGDDTLPAQVYSDTVTFTIAAQL